MLRLQETDNDHLLVDLDFKRSNNLRNDFYAMAAPGKGERRRLPPKFCFTPSLAAPQFPDN